MKKILLSSALCATMAFGDAAVLLPKEKRTFDQSKYIPDISAILDLSLVNHSLEDDELAHLEVPGVAHGIMGEHDHNGENHATYNAKNGFNLNYLELVLSSSVDPFLSMDAVLHFSEHGAEIEEAYFTTTALGHGLRARGGKLLSNFGYLNAQHHHYWDFADMPLVYESFLGSHGINELGAQIQWTAPLPFYLMAGFEVLQGTNEGMFGNETIGDAENPIAKGKSAPSLVVGYVKSSHDFGNTTVAGGISYAQGSARIDHSGEENPHAFSGDSKLYGADLVVLHQIDSYSSLKWQSEFLARELDGTQYNLDANDPLDPTLATAVDMNKKQSGLYTQLIYAPNQSWKCGVRYDTILQNDVTANGAGRPQPNGLNKYTAMVEYHTSEFARFRLQYSQNNALFNEAGGREKVDTLLLQANISIGAHSAHSF